MYKSLQMQVNKKISGFANSRHCFTAVGSSQKSMPLLAFRTTFEYTSAGRWDEAREPRRSPARSMLGGRLQAWVSLRIFWGTTRFARVLSLLASDSPVSLGDVSCTEKLSLNFEQFKLFEKSSLKSYRLKLHERLLQIIKGIGKSLLITGNRLSTFYG